MSRCLRDGVSRDSTSRQSDYSIASAAAQICAEDSGVVTNVRLGIGSVGDYPELLNVAELIGTPLNDNLIKDIVESATAEIETVEDLHASGVSKKSGHGIGLYEHYLTRVTTSRD